MHENTDFQIASIAFLKVLGEYVRLVDYIRGIIKFDDDSVATYTGSGEWKITLPSGSEETKTSPMAVLALLS